MSVLRHLAEGLPGVLKLKDGHAFSLGHTPNLPTCEARRHGEERVVKGGAGVATRRVICRKDASDAYAWEDLARVATTQSATIASGAVTVSGPWVTLLTVDTEAAAASDDLVTISGGTAGQVLTLHQANDARNVTFQDNSGNLRLAGDYTGGEAVDTITVVYNGTVWLEVARSNNA